jgi:DNA-binding CsgD family transcriptional regulator
MSTEQISSLIAEIYGTARDRSRWGSVLRASVNYLGASSASILIKNHSISPGEEFYVGGEDEYEGFRFAQCLTAGISVKQRNLRDGHGTDDYITQRSTEIIETRLFDSSAAELSETDHCIARLTLFRRGGGWDDHAQQRMQLIVPHIRLAVLISQRMRSRCVAASTFADALNSLRASIFLVDANGEMVHANEKGQAELANGHLLRSVRGKLTVTEPRAVFNSARAFALNYTHSARFSLIYKPAHGAAAIDCCHMLHVFPLAGGAENERGRDRPVVAGLVLDEATLHARDPVERMARHYGLARRQRELLFGIVEGNALTDLAHTLSVAASTMKTHLRRLLEKTGTRRQIELIKLCAAFRSPIQNNP